MDPLDREREGDPVPWGTGTEGETEEELMYDWEDDEGTDDGDVYATAESLGSPLLPCIWD